MGIITNTISYDEPFLKSQKWLSLCYSSAWYYIKYIGGGRVGYFKRKSSSNNDYYNFLNRFIQ